MATFHKPIDFNEHLLYGLHDFVSYTYKLAFVNDMTDEISFFDDAKEISEGGGYVKGGFELPLKVNKSKTTGIITVTTDESIEFALDGEIEDFQYVVLYTPDDRRKPIACYWDYGEKISLNNEVLQFNFGGTSSNGSILTII